MNKQPAPLDIEQAGKLKELYPDLECDEVITKHKQHLCKNGCQFKGMSHCGDCYYEEVYSIEKTSTVHGHRSGYLEIIELPSSDECWPLIIDFCENDWALPCLYFGIESGKWIFERNEEHPSSENTIFPNIGKKELAQAMRAALITLHEG